MFADPQTVTINSVANTLPRVSGPSTNGNQVSTVYQNSDESLKQQVSHQKSGTRTRSTVRLDQRKVVTNPLDSTNDYDTLSFYFVVDRPEYGFTVTDVQNLIAGLKTWLDNAAIAKLYGKES